jgi:hypothetical protein
VKAVASYRPPQHPPRDKIFCPICLIRRHRLISRCHTDQTSEIVRQGITEISIRLRFKGHGQVAPCRPVLQPAETVILSEVAAATERRIPVFKPKRNAVINPLVELITGPQTVAKVNSLRAMTKISARAARFCKWQTIGAKSMKVNMLVKVYHKPLKEGPKILALIFS